MGKSHARVMPLIRGGSSSAYVGRGHERSEVCQHASPCIHVIDGFGGYQSNATANTVFACICFCETGLMEPVWSKPTVRNNCSPCAIAGASFRPETAAVPVRAGAGSGECVEQIVQAFDLKQLQLLCVQEQAVVNVSMGQTADPLALVRAPHR
eukprot:1144703-Pelagomonas_calceolata.AAC.9